MEKQFNRRQELKLKFLSIYIFSVFVTLEKAFFRNDILDHDSAVQEIV